MRTRNRCYRLLILLTMLACAQLVQPKVCAQDTPDTSSTGSNSPQAARELLPSIIYTYNEQHELVPFVEAFPWDAYRQLTDQAASTPRPGCVVTDLRLDIQTQDSYATARNKIVLKIVKDGQHRVPLGMPRCHFLSHPRVVSDVPDTSVFAQFNQEEQIHELIVTGRAGQLLELEFSTQLGLKKIGSRTFFRMNVPRLPASQMTVRTSATNVVAGTTDGMTVKTIANASPDAQGTTFQVDGLLPKFEFWWQPRGEGDETANAFEVEGDIETTVNSLGKVSSIATLSLTSYGKPVEGFLVQLPPDARWSKNLASDEYSLSLAKKVGDRETLQVIFADAAIIPPAVRIVVETQEHQEPSTQSLQYNIAAFNVLDAATQYGNVRVYSEGDWTLEFTKGDYARETNTPSDSATRTFAYSRLDQLSMTVTKPASELIVEPVYVVTMEETVARLTAVFRCTRRGTRQGTLQIEMGDWIYQNLRSGADTVTIDNPELLSPTNGLLEIPVASTTDRFDLAITATRPIENGLAVVADDAEETGRASVSKLLLDFPVPTQARLLHATVALQNEKSLSVHAGFTTAYSEISVPESLRSDVEFDLRPLCFRMRASGRPATFPVMAARLARSTTVDISTEILNITPERIRIRQQMQWQVKGVPLNTALLTVTKQIYDYGNLKIDINGRPTVYSRTGAFDNLTGNDEVTVQVPLESRDLGSFELVVTYDWAHWANGDLEAWEFLDAVDLDLILPQRPSLVSAAGRITIRHGFRKPRLPGYEVTLDPIGNENINWVWEIPDAPSADLAVADTSINMIPLMMQRRATTETQPEPFDALVDRTWVQTWCTETERTDRAVFRVQGGNDELQITVPAAATTNLTVWVDSKVADFRKSGDGPISIDLDANQNTHVIELFYARPRQTTGLLETNVPRIVDAELTGQWYWHVVLPRNECLVTWPRRLTRAHHWDWSSLIPRRKSELTTTELENWSGALPTRAKVHAGSSEYLFGIMGEPETLYIRTTPLPLYMLTMTGLVLVAGSLLFYAKRPTVVLLFLGTAIGGGIYANPAFASVAGQFVVFGILLVVMGQILAWTLNHAPGRLAVGLQSPTTWMHRLELPNQEKSRSKSGGPSGSHPSTPLGSGSSSYRSVP